MAQILDHAPGVAPPTVLQEWDLIRSAIDLVMTGVCRRVVIAGIRFGEALLGPADRQAQEAGVRLETLPRGDGTGADISVERILRREATPWT